MKIERWQWGLFPKLVCISFVSFLFVVSSTANENWVPVTQTNRDVTILVTAMPDNDRTRQITDKLQPSDFAVLEKKRSQKIISVKRASEAPPVVAVLIQDDLVSRVNNELNVIRDFIRGLPKGARVMTAYIGSGSIQVRQEFTSDLEKAAKSLRILMSSDAASPYSPYLGVVEALRKFDDRIGDRRMILLVSDGLDASRGFRWLSSLFSVDLDRAISEGQRRNVAVFGIYAPSVGVTSISRHAANIGQGSLIRLADGTGGEAFFSGTDFVTFDPYLKEYNELLGRQWLITYRSNNTGKGFRRIEVTTDFDIHLHHPAGYDAK